MRKYFFTGLVILLPAALTVMIVVFLVNLLTQPFMGMIEDLLGRLEVMEVIRDVPAARIILRILAQIVILLALFVFTVVLGMITRWFFFKSLLRVGDLVLHRIPIVNKVYKTAQEIMRTLFASKTKSFKQVVMVPFPSADTYSVGLVSGDSPPVCRAGAKADLISVFLPTTPNPTSGYLLMFPRERCVFVDMKVEDAIKFIISCGMIHEGSAHDFIEEAVETGQRKAEPPPSPTAD